MEARGLVLCRKHSALLGTVECRYGAIVSIHFNMIFPETTDCHITLVAWARYNVGCNSPSGKSGIVRSLIHVLFSIIQYFDMVVRVFLS